MHDINHILKTFEKWLMENRPSYIAGLNPPCAIQDLENLQAILRLPIDVTFKTLLLWHDGQSPATESLMRSLYLMPSNEIVKALNIFKDLANEKATDYWSDSWIPFVADGFGNHIVYCLNKGSIIQFWHDDDDRELIANSLNEWIELILEEFQSDDWVLSGNSYILQSDQQIERAWDKVDIVLDRMPDGGIKSLKIIKDDLSVPLGTNKIFVDLKSGPVTLITGAYLATIEVKFKKLQEEFSCLSLYAEGNHKDKINIAAL